MLKIVKTYKFRLTPSRAKAAKMAQHAGASRKIWNCGIDYMESRRACGMKSVRFMTKNEGLAAFFTQLRQDKDYLWLQNLSSASLRYSLKRLDVAYRMAFQRRKQGGEAGFPKYHKRRDDESFTIPQSGSFALGERGIRLERIGWVRMRRNHGRGDCAVEGTPKMVVVKREAGRWFACVQCEIDAPAPRPHTGAAVGIDMGVAKSYTLSTGDIKQIPQAKVLEARKRRYERMMARRRDAALRRFGWDGKSEMRRSAEIGLGKQQAEERRVLQERGEYEMPPKYSARYEVAKRRGAKAARKLKNIRHNFLHHISSEIVREYGLIFVENLPGKNMTASAKGTAEEPGKNVAQKSGLNRSILAQGWGYMRGMLNYKTQWAGGRMETVAARDTSRRCAECGHIAQENRRTQADFKCLVCGHEDNADINAARNILWKGLEADGEAAFGRGDGGVSRSVKRQSLTEQRREISGKREAKLPEITDEQSAITNGDDSPLFCG